MTILNIAKEKSLYKKIAYTVMVLLVNAALAEIPVPGLNPLFFSSIFQSASALKFIDTLSGGALSGLSLASFGVTSYVSASIITQLLSVLIPKLEQLRSDGRRGKQVMDRINFTLAMCITMIGSVFLSVACGKSGMFVEYSVARMFFAAMCWMTGSAVIMVLAQRIEDHGIGNGISLVMCFNILSRLPEEVAAFGGHPIDSVAAIVGFAMLVIILGLFFAGVVMLQRSALNVPIRQNKKRVSVLNSEAVLPIPVNVANIMPLIYTSSLLSMPVLLTSIFRISTDGFWGKLIEAFTPSCWYSPKGVHHVVGFFFYVFLLWAFSFFSAQMSFNADEIANKMRKGGDTIPGISPGEDTARFLEKRRNIMTALNFVFLAFIAVVPDFICAKFGFTHFSFFGTSSIIVISVLLDTGHRLCAASIHRDPKYNLFVGTRDFGSPASQDNKGETIVSATTVKEIVCGITWPSTAYALKCGFALLLWAFALATILQFYGAAVYQLVL